MARRATQVSSTRQRILDSAVALYSKKGIARTTLGEIAAGADVARATVLNHFGTGDGVVRAALDRIAASLLVPGVEIFEGARSRAERARRLVHAMFEFYDRSTPWFELFRGEIASVPALREGERQFWEAIQPLYEGAFGALTHDRRAMATLATLTGPATLGALRQAGLSLSEAAEEMGDVVAAMLAQRRPRVLGQ